MKRTSLNIAAALLLCVVSAATVSAKVRSRAYGIGQDFRIAGTTVKAGTYVFSFDDEKNELTITDKKTKEVVARSEARAQDWGKGPAQLGVQLSGEAAPLAFVGISFDGKQVIRTSADAAAQQK